MTDTLLASAPADRMRLVAVSSDLLELEGIDERDRELITTNTRRYWAQEHPAPTVGDIVRLDWAGINSVRIGYLWRDGHFQPATSSGRFHLRADAIDYDGNLDLPKPSRHLALMAKPEWARCWIYHHGIVQPHNTIEVEILRRVWVHDRDFSS